MGYYLLFCLILGLIVSQIIAYFYVLARMRHGITMNRREKFWYYAKALLGWPMILIELSVQLKEFPRLVIGALAVWLIAMFVVALVGFLESFFLFWSAFGYAAFASGIWFMVGYLVFGFIEGAKDGTLLEP